MDKKDENYIYYLEARNLKIQRKRKHLTQSQFAELFNYSDIILLQ